MTITEQVIADDNEDHLMDDRTPDEVKKAEEDADLYSFKNFSI